MMQSTTAAWADNSTDATSTRQQRIDPDRIVRLHYVDRGPADRPAVDSLLDVVRQRNSIEPELA